VIEMSVREVYTSPDVMRLTGITRRQLADWVRLGVITPSIALGLGKGHGPNRKDHKWSLSDIIALRAMMRLRNMGILPSSLKRVAEYLRRLDPPCTFTNVWLVSDGRDVFHVRSENDAVSLTLKPGQMVFTAWVIDLGEVEAEVQELLKAA
jgi:hypothetical protein